MSVIQLCSSSIELAILDLLPVHRITLSTHTHTHTRAIYQTSWKLKDCRKGSWSSLLRLETRKRDIKNVASLFKIILGYPTVRGSLLALHPTKSFISSSQLFSILFSPPDSALRSKRTHSSPWLMRSNLVSIFYCLGSCSLYFIFQPGRFSSHFWRQCQPVKTHSTSHLIHFLLHYTK